MNAIPYDRPDEGWDSYQEGTEDYSLPGRPRRQWFNKTSAAVFALLLAVDVWIIELWLITLKLLVVSEPGVGGSSRLRMFVTSVCAAFS